MGARGATKTKTLAMDNASKITKLREDGKNGEYADLYRTIVSGPSGQRADLRIARIRYREFGPDEFTIVDIAGDCGTAGYAREVYHPKHGRCWYLMAEDWDGTLRSLGHASSLSIGCDVLINGEFAAVGRHDHRRISSGWFRRSGS
jgi:hypothetical protein